VSNVIQIGDFALTRNRERHFQRNGVCRHMHVSCDDVGDIVTCDDCGKQVSAYWALGFFSQVWEREMAKITARENRLAENESKSIHLLAAQKVEKVWRTRGMVPACPHCERGILASDGLGNTQVNKALELRRRGSP
jgi:hypothetical protein